MRFYCALSLTTRKAVFAILNVLRFGGVATLLGLGGMFFVLAEKKKMRTMVMIIADSWVINQLSTTNSSVFHQRKLRLCVTG